MNTYLAIWGGLLTLSGVAMHFLLIGMEYVTFFMAPAYLPPAQIVSYGVIIAGLVLLGASFTIRWPRYATMSNDAASRYFGRIALFNGLAAAVFVAPMLVPPLQLPILLTEWPGIYIVIAYAFFVIFGVMGMLAWSVMYHFAPAFFSRRELLDRRSILVQLVLSEVAIYSVSTVLFAAGYIGAREVHDVTLGNPVMDPLVGSSMEFSDIPAAVSIFLIVVSVFLGAITLVTGKARPSETNDAATGSDLPSPGTAR
ncbi:MAG TPA: hypothetical protein VGS04_06045 [Nitrososphaerales archaeon]|nr:hypothetical protein [Nitrososphaerales archaeon]